MFERIKWTPFFLVALFPGRTVLAADWSDTLGLNMFGYGDQSEVEPGFGFIDQALTLDVRPNAEFEYDRFKFTAVPRFIAQTAQIDGNQYQTANFSINELTAAVSVNDSLSLHAGKESYQWGPAELLSPSNPIFHYTPDSRSIVFLQPGKWLGRANLSIGKNFSAIVLFEPVENDDPLWSIDRPASKKALLKLEERFGDGATYLGLTGGRGEVNRPFVGEYGNFVLSDMMSIYFDARHTQGNDAYYPVALPSGEIALETLPGEDETTETLAIAGVRAEGAFDFRLEYLYNQAGYTNAQFLEALNSTDRNRLISTGLEVFGIHSIYASLRKADIDSAKLYSANLRYLLSLDDDSGAVFGEVERLFGDHCVGFFEGTFVHGGSYSESGYLFNYALRLGAKLTL